MRPMQIIALVLMLAGAAVGQTNRGGISGTVLDQNGAAIPGATVTVTNVGTGQKQTVTTSDDGAFAVQSLDPVTYSITVEAQGFKTATIQSLKVDTATTATANVIMEAGAVGEQVTVVADAPLVNTESGTTTTTVTERQIQDIPLANRSVLDLAVTAPNVSGDAGSEDPGVDGDQPVPGFNLSANGGRPGSTAILADGVNNTGVGIARSVVSFTPETVQEFTVQTSAYSAEFGNTAGGVINASTKSGTNDFNGVALWYTRNPKFNARRYRIGEGPRPANNLRYNQVSFTVGGPVYLPRFGEGGKALYDGHNRTFFFFAYEPRWRRDFLSEAALVPTLAERAGDFRNIIHTDSGFLPADVAAHFGQTSLGNSNIYQQFALVNGQLRPIVLTGSNQYCQFGDPRAIQTATGPQCTAATNANPNPALNVIPSAFLDPTAPRILQFQPVGGDYFLDEEGLVRNYLVQRFVTQDETRYTLRLDHNITENNKANFRYTRTPAIGLRGFGSDINGNTGVYSNAQQYLFADNHIFSSNVVNDLRLNYTRGNFSEDFTPEFSILGGRSLARELGLPTLTQGGIPLFQIAQDTAYTTIGGNIGASSSTNNFNLEQRYNISDIVYWTKGNMTWKFGVDLSDARLRSIPFFGASGGRWEFRTLNTAATRSTNFATNGGNTLASMLIGVPNVVQVRPLLLDYDYRWKSGAAFVQNDWKVRPNLTLNLGLRYSLQFPRTEKNNLQGVFRPDLAVTRELTTAQRRAIASGTGGLGIPATSPIPDYVPTSIQIPPFAFAGRGGRSKYLTPVDYWGLEPRFGFAYSPKMNLFGLDLESRSVVVRGGYGISHAPITGNNRSPNPDFGGFTGVSTLANGSTAGGTPDPTRPVRLSDNAPTFGGGTLEQRLGMTADGLVIDNSLGLGDVAVAVADSGKIPYSQNWNLSLSFEPFKNTVVEFAYVGNKGTHLYMPRVNINPKDPEFVEFLEASNIAAETTFNDPLGRTNVLGATVAIRRNSITAPFFGFNNLFRFFDPSANSIRHAGYIDVRRRVARGLTFTANYTYGKSIDDASDASPDTRVLTSGSTLGHVTYGVPRSVDRSVSAFDVKHAFSSTFVWDIPIGRGRWLLADAPGVVDAVLGGWSVSGLFRVQGGLPFLPYITDTNSLGGINRTVRLDIVEGVPLKNPLYDSSCQIGAACEPYVNPAAFMRPVKGLLGNAPRTIDALRGPNQEFFDLSFQKNFPWPFARNEKRRINFRVDLLNALNHPNFRLAQNGNTPPGFGGAPTEVTITNAEYDAWRAFSPSTRPARSTAAGAALLTQINNRIVNSRLPSGALPLDFFRVPIPEGFRSVDLNSFDINSLQGLRLYRLRQQYNTAWGVLSEINSPRYVQFGLRIFF
ncbi:MAG TPA: carboxypeptidase-like regulatory domain-containing protein [Pyrinomonadaceae bacterium]|nr:carboxypeptidase-like regulatory domain-containing protein [Pyrinomonadaceae bacterium]